MLISDKDYEKFYDWWRYIHDKYDEETYNNTLKKKRSNCAAGARLRRCKSLVEISFEQAYVNLRQLFPHINPNCIAVIAGLLAHIKNIKFVSSNEENYFAKQLAGIDNKSDKSDKKSVPVKPLRFQKLLNAQALDELYLKLKRVTSMLAEPIDLKSLIYGICHWNDKLKQDWAYAYYSVLPNDEE